MSSWECPHCKCEYDYSCCPDILEGSSTGGKTSFDCDECGCYFEMWVDFDPRFTIDGESVKLPIAEKAA